MTLNNFNSDEYAYADVEISFAGAPATYKMRGVQYMIESDDEELFCGGDEAVGIQSGNIKKSGMVKFTGVALDAINAAAVAANGRFALDLRFDMSVTYLPGVTRPLIIDVLGGCKINKMTKGMEQGAKWMDCELPFKFLLFNGQ